MSLRLAGKAEGLTLRVGRSVTESIFVATNVEGKQAPEVALLALLEVIFGIVLAWIGADEIPGQTVLSGGALVMGALVANEVVGWRQRT